MFMSNLFVDRDNDKMASCFWFLLLCIVLSTLFIFCLLWCIENNMSFSIDVLVGAAFASKKLLSFFYVCFYNPLLLLFVCVLYFLETRLFQILMIQRFKSKLVHQPDDVVVSIVCWRLLAAKKVTANLLPYSIPVVTVGFNLSWTMQLLFPFSQLLNFLTDASTTKSGFPANR